MKSTFNTASLLFLTLAFASMLLSGRTFSIEVSNTVSKAPLTPPSKAKATTNAVQVTTADEIEWGYLNPLRGALSPGAADLWGDRTTNTATGMLVRFKKGFESPPHIHNITYRGIVIDGLLHNDDPTSQKMWMPAGSFWTQPAGENHTTAANADTNMIYLEIDAGPYLVKPANAQFDNGERPLNLHRDNIVWLSSSDLHNIDAEGVQSTYVWGTTTKGSTTAKNGSVSMNGSMIKLPAGFNGSIISKAPEFRAVVIAGSIEYGKADKRPAQTLRPGSYVESTGNITHGIENKSNAEAIVYIRTNAGYTITSG